MYHVNVAEYFALTTWGTHHTFAPTLTTELLQGRGIPSPTPSLITAQLMYAGVINLL